MTIVTKTAVISLMAISCSLGSHAQKQNAQGHWVSAWSTAVQAPRSGPGSPAAVPFDRQTLRMVIRPTIGGERVRIRLSNEFGTTPLSVGSAHIALVKEDGAIVPGSDKGLRFHGVESVNIPVGAPMFSDAMDFHVPALTEIAVSVFLPKETVPATFHLLGQHATYISEPGDFTGATSIVSVKDSKAWFFLSEMDVWSGEKTEAVVTLGDSITDGFGAKSQYGDWPNQLADRLAEAKGAKPLAVDNEGIGGNRILWDGAGVSALARFDRDVLSQPGVKDLIILEGINDIGWSHLKPRVLPDGTMGKNPFAAQVVTANDLILGLVQMIDRAHEHGIRVFGATMTPYEGATGSYTEDGETVRQSVNEWIRSGKAFDGVFDFDAAVRDPNNPKRMREELQTGDHLHPNAAGYKVMAAAIDLSKLR